MTPDVSAESLVAGFHAGGWRIATVESCTGGLVAAAITDVAGASAVFEQGFVTYSNAAKTTLVGVCADLIDAVGAVSPEVALAMAEGGLQRSGADVALAVTGIAGPGGGSTAKPVGLVQFAVAWRGGRFHRTERFGDLGRDGIRRASVRTALNLLESWRLQAVGDAPGRP